MASPPHARKLFPLLLLILAAAALGGSAQVTAAPTASVFVATTGSDSNPCTSAAPCLTLDRAYHVATPGQVVSVAAGTYSDQTITADATKTSTSDVVFQPAGAVSVSSLDVVGSHLEFDGMVFTNFQWRTEPAATDVTFRNDSAPKFTIAGSSQVSVIGGTYGPIDNASNEIAPSSPTDTTVPTNILIDGVTIHGYHQTDGVSHVDCIHSWGVNGLTIRNSLMYDCEHFDILFTLDSVVGSPTNVTIENNFLDCCRSGFFSIYLGDQHGEQWQNFVIRNNSTDEPIGIGPANTTVSGLGFYGNIAPSFQGCGRTGVDADYNVWYAGTVCGAHDQVAPSGYANPTAHDFHLAAGAAAIDRGDPASYPATDYDGQARPIGLGPDAGADESGVAAVSPPANTGAPTISGAATQGSALTASSGTWTNSPGSYAYRWQRCNAAGASCASISGATAQTYTVAPADVGSTLRAAVTATNAGGSATATSAQTGVVTNGLVAAYAFDEGSGTTAADVSGKGNIGTISNATWTSGGKYGSALSFNGTSAYVSVPDAASLDLSNQLTLEAWVKPTALSGWEAIVNKEQPGNITYGLFANSATSQPAGIIYPVGGTGESITRGTAQLATSVWTHVAATYDGSTLSLYVNGTLASSLAVSASIVTSASPLKIGGNSIWGEYFNGLIDNVRIYNRSLAQSEIQTDMNAAISSAAPPANTAIPSISGTPSQGSVLTAAPGTWTNSPTYAYQWRRCDSAGANCTNISGATATTYTVAAADAGSTLRVLVTATNAAGSATAVSAQVAVAANSGGPVAAYAFDEGSGATTADNSSNGNTGTITNATWAAGKYGNALSFNGTSAFVTIADAPSLELAKQMTVEAWVKPAALSAWQAVVNKEQPGNVTYGVWANSDTNQPAAIIYPSGGTGESIARGPGQLAAGTWTHLAATYDGTTLKLYVNGALASSLAVTGSIASSTSPLRIGGNSIWGEYFNGLIDDVRIYSRALAQPEIQTDMNTPVDPPPPPPPGDTTPPSTPTGLATSGATQTSVTLSWSASTDNVGVAGYGLYRGATSVGSTSSGSYTFTGLACGTSYTLGVDAYDAAGNRSTQATTTGSTAACPPPGDTTPPTTPTGLATSGATQTAVTLSWTASTDNVGVAGYGLYRNGTSVTSATTTSYTFTGLACGTSYTLGVDAYDAVGNRSAQATKTASTGACSGGGGTPSAYLSPSGSDSNPCTSSAPCASLNRGYQAAPAAGGIVQLAGGYYGCGSINADSSKTGTVVFQSAPGATAWTTCQLSLSANHLEFDNMNMEGIRTTSSQYVTLRNVNVTCLDQAPFEMWGGKCSAGLFIFAPAGNFSMYGGSVGPTWDDTYDGAPGQSQVGINLGGGSATVNNLLFDGVRFHDNRRIDDQQHTSCLMVGGGNGVTIRNSRFENCAVFDLFLTWWNFVSPQYPPGTNILLENNFFDTAVAGCSGCTAGYFSVEFASYQPVWQNVTVRYNSASQAMHFDGSHSNFVATANAMPMVSYDCPSDVTYSYNVSTGGGCGGTGSKVVSDLGFVNAPAGDLHLTPTSPAINAGNPSSYPPTDIDGNTRPKGAAPDAGATEAG